MREYNQQVQLTVQNKLDSVQALNLAKEIILNEFDMSSGDYNITNQGILTKSVEGSEPETLREATDTDKAVFIIVHAIVDKVNEYTQSA